MPSLRVERLGYAYAGRAALFSNLQFHLQSEWIGIVGENGTGKSTFLRLIAGELEPDSGRIELLPKNAAIAYCPQNVDAADQSIFTFLGQNDRIARRLREELRLNPIDLQRWSTLSPGERKRWQIGAALAQEPDLLLLDEPTNHIDEEARALLIGSLQAFQGLGLCVSHDRALLSSLCRQTLRFTQGAAFLYRGNYDEAKNTWEDERKNELSAHHKARDRRETLSQKLGAARHSQASADAARNTQSRIKGPRDHDGRSMGAKFRVNSAEKRLSKSVSVLRHKVETAMEQESAIQIQKELGRSIFIGYEPSPSPFPFVLDAPVLRAGAKEVLKNVRVSVGRSDRIRITGKNGAGKTTLTLALLKHARIREDKILYMPQELGPEERKSLLPKLFAMPSKARGRILSAVAALGVDPDRLLASALPSPGESRKLLIALGLCTHAWALVLDEPTNHMDLPSIERLENALLSYPGCILFISHDQSFGRRVATIEWHLDGASIHLGSLEKPREIPDDQYHAMNSHHG